MLTLNRSPLLVVLGLAALTASCGGSSGSPTVQCQTSSCGSGANGTFQVCAHANGDVTYEFGNLSCSCPASNSSQCNTCADEVANFCTGGPVGTGGSTGTGGTGGSVGTGGTGAAPAFCTATFSGAFSGSFTPCAVTITYLPAQGQWSANTAGGAISGSSYTWTGMSFVWDGMPSTGTFDQNQSFGASNEITQPSSSDPPIWESGYGNGYIFGTATLTIDSLGPSIEVAGQTLYQSPHGTWTGTALDQNPQTNQPEVMQVITF